MYEEEKQVEDLPLEDNTKYLFALLGQKDWLMYHNLSQLLLRNEHGDVK